MLGFDSCAIIDFFNGNKAVFSFITNEKIVLADISLFEVLVGSTRDSDALRFFAQFASIPMNQNIIFHAKRIFLACKLRGHEIPAFDCLIAASFLSQGVTTIVTNDKHFLRIKELRVLLY